MGTWWLVINHKLLGEAYRKQQASIAIKKLIEYPLFYRKT